MYRARWSGWWMCVGFKSKHIYIWVVTNNINLAPITKRTKLIHNMRWYMESPTTVIRLNTPYQNKRTIGFNPVGVFAGLCPLLSAYLGKLSRTLISFFSLDFQHPPPKISRTLPTSHLKPRDFYSLKQSTIKRKNFSRFLQPLVDWFLFLSLNLTFYFNYV